jgi:glycosyltransferase involved in cell wall biosynthesis
MSLFGRFPVTTIKGAVDPTRFYPVNRLEARRRLGIPRDAKTVMLSVACNVMDSRKGLDIALAALRKLSDLNLFLLPTGISGDPVSLKTAMEGAGGLDPKNISDDSLLRDYYAAADILWHPSRADNYPMVLLEAAACGTPSIATAVGGVPEIVTTDRGVLISPNDPDALARATRIFFQDSNSRSESQFRLATLDTITEYKRFINEHESIYKKCLI